MHEKEHWLSHEENVRVDKGVKVMHIVAHGKCFSRFYE